MNKVRGKLNRRMLGIMLLAFVPMVIAITIVFMQTIKNQRESETERLIFTNMQISSVIDNITSDVYNASDNFSQNKELEQQINREFGDDILKKRLAIISITNKIFDNYNNLEKRKRIDAIYNAPKAELFNFLDPNQDEYIVMTNLHKLAVNAPDKTSKFCWYGLQDNFLVSQKYGEVRRDQSIFGSRRVYMPSIAGYPYIHIFAIEEQTIYDSYKLLAGSVGAEVYVLAPNNVLMSSTNEQAVGVGELSQEMLDVLNKATQTPINSKLNNTNYTMCQTVSELTGWRTVIMLPTESFTKAVNGLYIKMIWIMIACFGFCGLLIIFMYRKFMAPVSELNSAMQRVNMGDLDAYLAPQGHQEIVHMIKSYNSMLDGIKRNMSEKMNMEKSKSALEMQVLMYQINPHFLYNTLETIVWRAGEAGRPDIGKIAASLGKLYRLSIGGGLMVPLSQELEHVQAYVNIQKCRYGENVEYTVDLKNEEIKEHKVLKLILQPVVENCFLYALEDLTHILKIRVRVRNVDNKIKITITDNGIGMSAKALSDVRIQTEAGVSVASSEERKSKRGTGIGLNNVYARLKMYPDLLGSINIYSKQNIGTKIVIILA